MIGGLNKLQIALIITALIGLVLFLSAPRIPKALDKKVSEVVTIDEQVQEAVNMVQNGERPMEGILKLREILENDPDNIDAAYQLGLFSIQSGQMENAIKRFGQVVDKDETGKYKDAHVYLGNTHAALGDKEKALKSFNDYIEMESDTSLTNQVRALITELESTR